MACLVYSLVEKKICLVIGQPAQSQAVLQFRETYYQRQSWENSKRSCNLVDLTMFKDLNIIFLNQTFKRKKWVEEISINENDIIR